MPLTNSLHLIPAHIYFAFQVVMIPGAVLGAVFITKLLELDVPAWPLRLGTVGLVIILIAAQAPTPDRLGAWATKREFQGLRSRCADDHATCVCFAPWHPIFCRDAADLYLVSDEEIPRTPSFSPRMRKMHQQLWPAAIAAIEKGTPSVIGDNDIWELAHQYEVIDDELYRRFQQAVQRLYDCSDVEGKPVYTLRDLPSREKPVEAGNALR